MATYRKNQNPYDYKYDAFFRIVKEDIDIYYHCYIITDNRVDIKKPKRHHAQDQFAREHLFQGKRRLERFYKNHLTQDQKDLIDYKITIRLNKDKEYDSNCFETVDLDYDVDQRCWRHNVSLFEA